MQERAVPPLPGSEPLRQDIHDVVELFPGQVTIWVGFAAKLEQRVFAPVLGGAGRYHLLSQDVQRPGRNLQCVQITLGYSPGQGGALNQFVPGQGEKPSFGGSPNGVP